MPENNQTPQTVDLNSVNANQNPAPQEGFFDKQIKSFAGFMAKMTGQPDPITGTSNAPQMPTAPQQPQSEMPAPAPEKELSFFDKLVSNTQGLLNKTQQVASSIVDKTSSFSNTVVQKTQDVATTVQNVSNTVVSTTQNAAQTIASAPQNMANTVGNIAQQATNTAQNFANQATQTVTTAVQTGQAFGSQAVNVVQNQTSSFLENPVATVQSAGSNITTKAENLAQQAVSTANQGTQQVQEQMQQDGIGGIFTQLTNGVTQVVEKTKEIGSSAIDNTKSFVQNPIEQIDNFVGSGVPESPVQSETSNTTSLDNLSQAQSESSPDSIPESSLDTTPGLYQ